LRRKIQIYLKSEKALVLKGEPYSIEQVRGVAEYILEGSDPRFEDIITVHQLEPSKRGPSPILAPVKSETTELLNAINMLGQNFQAALSGIQNRSLPPCQSFRPVQSSNFRPVWPVSPGRISQDQELEEAGVLYATKQLISSGSAIFSLSISQMAKWRGTAIT